VQSSTNGGSVADDGQRTAGPPENEIPLERDFKRAAGYIEDWRPYQKRQIMLGQV
jgi:hypothetical protein